MVGINANNEELMINSRVKVGHDFGIVKYVGEVEGYEGSWIGVEWDDKTRGRHNGTVKGVKYFETKHPKSASMIRREKIDKYETLSEAIENKYLCNESDSSVSSNLIQETQDVLSAAFLEVVGMDKIREKQKHLEFITDITIRDSSINGAGKLPDLSQLNSLCLKSSCISDWKTVGDILIQIPSLKTLDLSQNRIVLPENEMLVSGLPGNLETLLLNDCNLQNWDDILRIAQLFPNLQNLSLKENGISKLAEADPTRIFKNLKTLILNDNNIKDFTEILKLGNLENMKELILINNQIEEVVLPDCDYNSKLNIFPCLESLHIRDNPIKDELKSFNELDKLLQLKKISYLSNDTIKNDVTFANVVGLIWNLKYFNHSELDKNQKNDAQYEIWKRYAPEWIEVIDCLEDKLKFLKSHRVYEKLIEKYGNPEHIIIANKMKRATTIEVQFKNVANGKLYRKKLPLAMSIHTLYGLIYKLSNMGGYKMDSNSFKLYYVDAYNNNIKVYLDNLSKTLDYYSLHNGDTILIDY